MAKLPSAAELVAAALKVLRSRSDVLPCNRLAVSTNVFVPMITKTGSLSWLFSPQGKSKLSQDGREERRAVLAGSARRARLMDSEAPVETHSCEVSLPAMVPNSASTASAANASHTQHQPSVLQLEHLQGQVHGEAGASERALGPTSNGVTGSGDGVAMDCHLWLAHAALGKDYSTCVMDAGACEHAHSMNSQGNVQHEWSVSHSQSAGCPSAEAGQTVVHQRSQPGQTCAPAFGKTLSCADTAINVGRGLDDALLSPNGEREMHSVDRRGAAVAHAGAHTAKSTEPTSDHQEGIDVAEQRRIYHLIQMQSRHRRQGKYVSHGPVPRRAPLSGTQHGKPAGKQTSILSLLNKK